MSSTTNLNTLKINYMTQAQYDTALSGGQVNEDEIYVTPNSSLYKELTQAEYDALTEDEKNNGTVYFITDGIPQNEIASYSNQVLSLGNLRIYKGYKLVSNTGRSSITFPSGTFSQVLWAISFCDQPGFGGYDTTSVTELTTSKVTLYQYNSAGANMNVGVVVFGLA